jgi:ribonucleoside-diphosphate reductase alpha chain
MPVRNGIENERGEAIQVDCRCTLDWQPVRDLIAKHGMRNSNVLAIAPTATISTLIGVTQSIEPEYKLLYVKSNLSGEFTQVNHVLVNELKRRGLWDAQMLEELKYYDGSLQNIGRVPLDLRLRFLTSFEIEPQWLIECAARRQKWIDQGQSLNLYLAEPSGRKMHEMYFLAWSKGLKTTYYLRTLAATQVEKSTLDVNRFGIQPKWMKNKSASSDVELNRAGAVETAPQMCPITDPSCEACQ